MNKPKPVKGYEWVLVDKKRTRQLLRANKINPNYKVCDYKLVNGKLYELD